ncbi:transcription elongation factor S-II [Pilobolus umbonatus]|nr:transcription elongation factor S-II [Pilobolus umbonatus]
MESEEIIVKSKHALATALQENKLETCLDILNTLSTVKVNGELLKKTDVGRTIGKLRAHPDNKLSLKAKGLVKKWKEDVLRQSSVNNHHHNHSKHSNSEKSSNTRLATDISDPPQRSPSTSEESSPKSSVYDGPPRTVKSDEVTFSSTGSTPRNKTIEMFYSAIGYGSGADSELLLKRAISVEKRIYSEYGDINNDYKSKVRTLTMNLKNKSNPELRESVVSGELSVDALCSMSVDEMASEEAKARDRKLAEEALFKARGAESAQAETDMFKCGKCNGRKCTYFQMQTRSADEPMTTFVTCVLCGNHWKFC